MNAQVLETSASASTDALAESFSAKQKPLHSSQWCRVIVCILVVAHVVLVLRVLSVLTVRVTACGMTMIRALLTSVVIMTLFYLFVLAAVRILEACPRYELTPRNAVKNTTMYWLFRSELAHVGLLHVGSIRTMSSCQCRP